MYAAHFKLLCRKVIRFGCLCMKSILRFCGWWGRSSTKSCVLGKIFNFGGSVVIGRGITVGTA